MARFELPALPYALDALEPFMSRETLEYHYGKHHQTYVNNLNALTEGTPFAEKSLEEVVRSSEGGVFNNAAQVWNHAFFWQSMKPQGGGLPSGALLAAIEAAWGSFDAFKKAFSDAAAGNFGSGWTWLVKKADARSPSSTRAMPGRRLRWKASSPFSRSTCGNMPTTSTTATPVRSSSKPTSRTSSTGRSPKRISPPDQGRKA